MKTLKDLKKTNGFKYSVYKRSKKSIVISFLKDWVIFGSITFISYMFVYMIMSYLN